MAEGYYQLDNQILKMYSQGKKVEVEFGLYISCKENIQRTHKDLSRGQFYMTVNQVSIDLNISSSMAQRTIQKYREKGIIKLIYKYERWEKKPSIWEVQSVVNNDNLSDRQSDSQTDNQKHTEIKGLESVSDNHFDNHLDNQNDNPKKEKLKRKLEKENIDAKVINYLNEKAVTNYSDTMKKTNELIGARENEGFVLDDFKKVIDNKVAEWKGTDFEKYLRPDTLFSTKFEGYLNQKVKLCTNKANIWLGIRQFN